MEVKARMVSSVPRKSEGPLGGVSGFCIVILLQIDTTRGWGITSNFFIPTIVNSVWASPPPTSGLWQFCQ